MKLYSFRSDAFAYDHIADFRQRQCPLNCRGARSYHPRLGEDELIVEKARFAADPDAAMALQHQGRCGQQDPPPNRNLEAFRHWSKPGYRMLGDGLLG